MAKEIWRPGNMLYPTPAVMVSCKREGEKPNIITVAWAGTICSDPAMLSISVRKARYSYDILMETGEFVVNLTSKKLTRAADWCGVRSGRDYDKFKEMNLTPLESQKISAPGIAESPVNIECKVKQSIDLGSHTIFIAEVMCVTVDDKLLDEKGKLDLGKAKLVAYSHGEYFMLGEKVGKFGYSVAKKTLTKKDSPKPNKGRSKTAKVKKK
ncbi:NADH-FMN oxidoreductase RutF, flavin reductase (DIM6/NTAB) family [Butyrivibrio proteoclasticus]|uniref:NADH-FMN oxidoreductase RutF, flavin reductase (DIM6/NTAB) family n=1 Tax=Butyrivibrio proteoclasticus TaxID=43305 RepID=A0A1I5UVF9_9FIRM|nr:flavin reductase family protein [Butyrivibrio proteoclasticus]SFP99190.1 NADH-FMN oxidoreductase RutF, flavin reductase (DIM6/NTAB) family [Butyrivibrio proteoclasticus]